VGIGRSPWSAQEIDRRDQRARRDQFQGDGSSDSSLTTAGMTIAQVRRGYNTKNGDDTGRPTPGRSRILHAKRTAPGLPFWQPRQALLEEEFSSDLDQAWPVLLAVREHAEAGAVEVGVHTSVKRSARDVECFKAEQEAVALVQVGGLFDGDVGFIETAPC